jgi:membrane protein
MEEHPIDSGFQDTIGYADQSPEARRKRALRWRAGLEEAVEQRVGPGTKTWCVLSRIWHGTYNDGSIHAGNLAYMALLALFPFFITVAAVFAAFGESEQTQASVRSFLVTLPPVVTRVIEPVAISALESRSGWLLWVGGLIGIWTVTSLIETLRDILHRAYGTPATLAFWRYRLLSTGLIVASVILLLLALFAQVLISAAQEVIAAWLPALQDLGLALSLSRLLPTLVLYGALFALFVTLTPSAYRGKVYPKWPGALFVTVWWTLVTMLLPPSLRLFFNFDLTYGSLAGVMIALFFFWLIGLGVVIGAELNAALTESPEERDMLGQADNRARAARREGRDVNDE